MKSRIEGLIAQHPDKRIAVGFRNIESGHEWFIAPDEVFHAASTMKVGVMMEVYRQAAAGLVQLDGSVVVRNRFASLVDGSEYRLGPEEDSDPELFDQIGQPVEVRELVRRMIVRSSNLATNELLCLVAAGEACDFMEFLGAPGVRILRGVEDGLAYAQGLNNTTTARALVTILTKLARHEVVSPAASEEMLNLMRDQEHNEAIPADLPPGIVVAHKTGWIGHIYHDAAIVESQPRFVLVVLTEGFPDEHAPPFVAEVARIVYEGVSG